MAGQSAQGVNESAGDVDERVVEAVGEAEAVDGVDQSVDLLGDRGVLAVVAGADLDVAEGAVDLRISAAGPVVGGRDPEAFEDAGKSLTGDELGGGCRSSSAQVVVHKGDLRVDLHVPVGTLDLRGELVVGKPLKAALCKVVVVGIALVCRKAGGCVHEESAPLARGGEDVCGWRLIACRLLRLRSTGERRLLPGR